ncbi:MAG: NTP transferase domain-containing protein [Candidatus Omnitrophota bacterium]
MQIIIPMSGIGRRFLDAGYQVPKPLIEVDGMPIIGHVAGLFPGEHDFTFICNNDHLRDTDMESVLRVVAPGCRIVGIPAHKKGPVFAVIQALDFVGDKEEVIVNYCDFSKAWDYAAFLREVRGSSADGAVSAYRGFHPHMLYPTNYAFMRADGPWMREIREKQPFTGDRMSEYASDGTYYFRAGRLVKQYFRQLMQEDVHLNGEFYVSLVYNLLIRDGLKVRIHEIEHMLQWGAPMDLREYQEWSDYFRLVTAPVQCPRQYPDTLNLIPMAGRGKRFVDEGYEDPKPLINVNGKPMVVQAAHALPPGGAWVFVCLRDHLERYPLAANLEGAFRAAKIVPLDAVTQGQACTCELGLEGCDPERPLLIAASDNGVLCDWDKYHGLVIDDDVDCAVWTFRHHPASAVNPKMYGWVRADAEGVIREVSVKVPISDDPFNDHAVVGTFYFRKARFFLDAVKRMYARDARVNNEFYVDMCINDILAMGLSARVFEVKRYICWGTPNDLKTYEYWRKFFHQCAWHPYRMENDMTRGGKNEA